VSADLVDHHQGLLGRGNALLGVRQRGDLEHRLVHGHTDRDDRGLGRRAHDQLLGTAGQDAGHVPGGLAILLCVR